MRMLFVVLGLVVINLVGYGQSIYSIDIIKPDYSKSLKLDTINYTFVKPTKNIYYKLDNPKNKLTVTDTLVNLQTQIYKLNKQNYLLKDGIIKFKQQTYKGQNNLLKGMILTTAGVVTLYLNKGGLNMGWIIVIGGLTLDIQGVSDMYNAYKHLNH
jgi:hypothetical protein